MRGPFLDEHRVEVLGLVRNVGSRERASHPLKRIIETREEPDRIVVTTTDLSLARSIGDALHHAYAGDLRYQYTKGADSLRVTWSR